MTPLGGVPDAGSPDAGSPDGVRTSPGIAYGPWRRWVRKLRARGGRRRALADGTDPHERAYLVYGLGLVVLMYAPILWAALTQVAAPLGRGDTSTEGVLVATGSVVVGLAGLGGVLLHRFGVPLWVTQTDAAYALAGVWDARAVLWRRVVVLVVGTAVAAGLIGSAVASGVLDPVVEGQQVGLGLGPVLAWGACAAGAAMVPLALAVAAQAPRWRAAARGLAVAVAGIGVVVVLQRSNLVIRDACPVAVLVTEPAPVPVPVSCPVAPLGPPSDVVAWSVALAVVAVALLVAVLPRYLDVDHAAAAWQRVAVTGAGLQGGDATGVGGVAAPTRPGRRSVPIPVRLAGGSPVVARDLLGLCRRPVAAAVSVAAGALGVLLVAMSRDLGPLAAMLGAVVLYAASAVWTSGLRATAAQPVPGGLLPGTPRDVVRAHLVAPGGLALVAGAGGLLLAAVVVGGPTWTTGAVVAGLLVVVLGARTWVAGASTVPVVLFTPVVGPTGDLSMLAVGAWFVRGWLLVAAVAWTADRWGATVAVAAVGLAWWLVRSAVRRLGRE